MSKSTPVRYAYVGSVKDYRLESYLSEALFLLELRFKLFDEDGAGCRKLVKLCCNFTLNYWAAGPYNSKNSLADSPGMGFTQEMLSKLALIRSTWTTAAAWSYPRLFSA